MTSLAETVEDIADKIIVGDWFTSESDDGSRSFYVIGAAAYWDDVQSGGRFTTCLVAPGSKVGPLADHTVRSQVACGRAQEYLKRERKRLEHAGVSSSVIDRFISGDIDDFAALFPESMTPEDALELISPFLEALRVSRGPVQLDDEEAQDVAAAREKLCLRELARKYGKIVNRWEQLDPLPFDNPQSEEASKAYLYGFYRSSVVLSASALEGHLNVPLVAIRNGAIRNLSRMLPLASA